ncbi:MAG: D-sedoheptulose 7-phosphate isomerase [Cytophagales bacterium]|nr:MAG: D-sedoheptulose 7-phosphate isomerase [Cytophagales bacterium]
MNYQSDIVKELEEAQILLTQFISSEENIQKIQSAAELMANSLKGGGKIISCGNGGSCCDAMHFAEELSGRYRENRPALAAISISDISHVSCVSNDYGYEEVFSRYLSAIGNKNDVLLAISTSGNSPNIIKAIQEAKNKNMLVIGLTGKEGGAMKDLCDIAIIVPHHRYADRIQEIHIKIIHIFIYLIEEMMFKHAS